MHRARLQSGLVMALAACLLALGPAAFAPASTPPRSCGTVKVGGKSFAVRAHMVGCRHARHHARRVLGGKAGPAGWICRRYDPRVTRIRFNCRRGGRDFYAIRR